MQEGSTLRRFMTAPTQLVEGSKYVDRMEHAQCAVRSFSVRQCVHYSDTERKTSSYQGSNLLNFIVSGQQNDSTHAVENVFTPAFDIVISKKYPHRMHDIAYVHDDIFRFPFSSCPPALSHHFAFALHLIMLM